MCPNPPVKLLPVILFNAGYMLAAVTVSAVQGNREFIFYIVVMLILIGVMGCVHRRVRLTAPLLWAFSLWGLAHMAGGLCPLPSGWPYNGDHAVLYSWWIIPEKLKYDQIVHAYGFGVTTWLCWHVLRTALRQPDGSALRPTFGMLTLCAAGGMEFGALNEVIEFIAVLTIPNTNVGGYENTGWDLFSNLAGASLAAVIIRFTSPVIR
ncbi:MAG: putative rane protein [Prosthecobacter sp.]|nr:putative rane protein [Prosthecobacter sp.]